MILIPLLLGLSFLVGYAIRRGSICAVLATRALIVDRRSARFRAFGVAAAALLSEVLEHLLLLSCLCRCHLLLCDLRRHVLRL